MENLFKNKKILWWTIIFLCALILGIGIFFGYREYLKIQIQEKTEKLSEAIQSWKIDIPNCRVILSSEMDSLIWKGYSFELGLQKMYEDCTKNFDISLRDIDQQFCTEMIKGNKGDYKDTYILLDWFEKKQEQCVEKYLKAEFSTGSLFDIDNDFKSQVQVDFSLPFYEDIDELNSEAFLENRSLAKRKFASYLKVNPKIEIKEEDITLYSKKAIVLLPLDPLTKYSFELWSYDSGIEWEKTKKQSFELQMPERKVLSIRSLQKVSLFEDTNTHQFELVSYGSGKDWAVVQICRIDNESYAKIEVFRESEGLEKEKRDFFTKGIDSLNHYECHEKNLRFPESSAWETLRRMTFDFSDEIGKIARSGLYYVTFKNPEYRDFNNTVQTPIFFWVIDSHITMKIWRNGEAFFFVNDFSGKPLVGQKIRIYANEFIWHKREYNDKTKDYDVEYFSPENTGVFSDEIILWTTNDEWILRVNMKWKLDTAFQKTFDSWKYKWEWNYDSFFVTSASETNLSYVSSKWNGGIWPWNFWYTVWWYWWGQRSENEDAIELSSWGSIEPSQYSHTYTDRILYLPGEEVYIKSILRKSTDLSILKGKEIELKIENPEWKDVLNKKLTINDFWSVSDVFQLSSDARLGYYRVILQDGDEQIWFTRFSVEIFKNPKFKNEIMLETKGLNDWLVKISDTKIEKTNWWYERKTHVGKFDIEASVSSKYYSGSPLKNAKYEYKVYKQYFYDNSYWVDCYYWCYWEPEKEFYSEWKGILDENGVAQFSIPVSFESNYADYRYIVEISTTDEAWDTISWSNSIIAKLPTEYKTWNPQSGIYFKWQKRFYKKWEKVTLEWGLQVWKFTGDYNDKYLLVIKKKNYITTYADDVRGQKRPITKIEEKLQDILLVNDSNFKVTVDGKLELDYTMQETGEYVFEFGKINDEISFSLTELIKDLKTSGEKYVQKQYSVNLEANYENTEKLMRYCDKQKEDCSKERFLRTWWCKKSYVDKDCRNKSASFKFAQRFSASDLIDYKNRKYFTLIAYGDTDASNPIQSDNKITVLSEKVSYKLWEKARVFVRLPFSKWKILWTVEKQWVLKHEYIDVPGNTFFKEITVDESFIPNAYIGVVAIDAEAPPPASLVSPSNRGNSENASLGEGGGWASAKSEGASSIPEYKVWYTEVVVDKTDKKTEISIVSNKKQYSPREEVTLDIDVSTLKWKWANHELTVMVVDDSLVSLMGNIDMNSLEKFYKKLPFQIQTSITNIAMLRNYYFSRKWIVGWSGFGNFKWWDSAVSSRNIFKNTAYYNPSVVTDVSWKAQVKFDLPDNLTNFRIMVLSQSKDNFFGYAEDFIEVRKDVIIQDKTPITLRDGDKVEVIAQIFNTTEKEIGFKASLTSEELNIWESEQELTVKGWESTVITWEIKNNNHCNSNLERCVIPYMMTILWDSAENSDKIEWNIEIKSSPSLLSTAMKSKILGEWESHDFSLDWGDNVDPEKSVYQLSISNSPLIGIEKIVGSLAMYPFGCGEQLLSSTMPNAVLKRYQWIYENINTDPEKVQNNIDEWLKKIYDMSLPDGGFKIWHGNTKGDIHITAYALRVLFLMQESWVEVDQKVIDWAVKFLEKNYGRALWYEKAESLWALARYHGEKTEEKLKIQDIRKWFDTASMRRHEMIAYTYALVLMDKEKYKTLIDKNIAIIEKLIKNGGSGSYYYNEISDTAEFVQMLIAYDYDKTIITKYINGLNNRDWSSYYFSTKTKANVFLAFIDYIEKYGKTNESETRITLNGNTKEQTIGWEINTLSEKKVLEEVLEDNSVALSVENVSWDPLFVTALIEEYPIDPLKVQAHSNGVEIKRTIYEVTDESDIEEKCEWIYGETPRSKSKYECTQPKWLTLHQWDTFKKWATYKIVLQADFDKDMERHNLTMEDYLPAGFRILNSKFKTNKIATNQETTQNSWRWSHVESRPDLIMAHADRFWGTQATYEYFITADFAWTFIYPPATVYKMYQPQTRANGVFRKIVIK